MALSSNNDVGESGLSQWQEFNEEVGYGKCSFERDTELSQQGTICRQEAKQEAISQIRPTTRGINLCPILDEIAKCFDSYSECYSTEEMVRFMGINLKVIVELTESIDLKSGSSQYAPVIGLLKSCPIYKQSVQNLQINE